MDLLTRKEEDFLIIEINGDVDASSSVILDQALKTALNQKEEKILVDCTDLNYISSPGLGVFMSYLRELEENQACLLLFNMNEKVRSTFKILGLDELLQIVENKETAKAQCLP